MDNRKNKLNRDFNLAKEGGRRRVRKMVVGLQRATDALTRRDIRDSDVAILDLPPLDNRRKPKPKTRAKK